MKRIVFVILIFLTLFATLVVIPSFKLDISGKTLVWPEIDYSKIFGGSDTLNFSFRKGSDFEGTTVVKMLVESGQEKDAKEVSEIVRQRIEIMSADGSVSYFKEAEDYYIKITVTNAGSLTDKQLFALTNSQKIQILKEKEQVTGEDGQPIVTEESPFTPVALDYDTAKSADFKFDSSIGRYVVEVEFDEVSLAGVSETLIAPSAGAFIGEDPIAAIVTGATATEAKMRFATSSEVGREESLVVYSLLATKTYPVPATEVSREVFAPQRSEKDLIVYGLAFIAGFLVVGAFFFFTYKPVWKFVVFCLGVFTVFTLALFKLPVFGAELTSGSLLGFLIGFIFAAGLMLFTASILSGVLGESSESTKEKLLNEIFKKKGADLRTFLLFILFLLIVLNMIYGKIGNDISVGFGYSIVTLLVLFVFFVKNIFWNFCVSPLSPKINVFRKNNKK